MISGALARVCYPPRKAFPAVESIDDIATYIESRALSFPSELEDAFAARALKLGVECGMVLDVGTRVGLAALKLLWQNENLYSIGMDRSGPMIEQARATASAWDLADRAMFQVGDPLNMRFKSAYFDLVISDCSLHRFSDAAAIFREIRRVLKPTGALLIRDFRRPNRFRMAAQTRSLTARFGQRMREQMHNAVASSYTAAELAQLADMQFPGIPLIDSDPDFILLERRGETDPGSWVLMREQYR